MISVPFGQSRSATRAAWWLQVALCLLVAALPATGALGLIVLVGRVLDREKNMAPFVASIDAVLPPGQPVYALGADETLEAIVPYVTGRRVVVADANALFAQRKGSDSAVDLSAHYRPALTGQFGPRRFMVLWRRCVGPCASGREAASAADPEE